MNRLVEPVEAAHAIAWLLSAASSGVTGTNLPVDADFIAGSTRDPLAACRKRAERSEATSMNIEVPRENLISSPPLSRATAHAC